MDVKWGRNFFFPDEVKKKTVMVLLGTHDSGHNALRMAQKPYILKKQLRAHTPYKNNSGHTQPYILKKQLGAHTP